MNPPRRHPAHGHAWWPLACSLLAAVLVGAAHAEDSERSRISRERGEIEARYAAREGECRRRFVVSSCVDDAKRDRRRELDALRARQLKLDEEARRERSAARRAELAAKAAEDARREQQRAARSASAPAARADAPRPLERRREDAAPARTGSAHDRPGAAGARLGLKQSGGATAAERQEREARSRASYESRLRQAEEHRQQAIEKAAKRLKEHPAAAPLPLPSSAPGH